MESGLALYNALIRINVPHETARDVVSALERDVGGADVSTLKADLEEIKGDMKAVKADVEVLKGDMKAVKADVEVLKGDVKDIKSDMRGLRTEVMASRELFEEKIHHLESRMTVRLGGMLAAGIGIMTTLLLLLHR